MSFIKYPSPPSPYVVIGKYGAIKALKKTGGLIAAKVHGFKFVTFKLSVKFFSG